jgi:hypothetical protein
MIDRIASDVLARSQCDGPCAIDRSKKSIVYERRIHRDGTQYLPGSHKLIIMVDRRQFA